MPINVCQDIMEKVSNFSWFRGDSGGVIWQRIEDYGLYKLQPASCLFSVVC